MYKCDKSETVVQSNSTGNSGMVKMKAVHEVVGIMRSAIEQKVKNYNSEYYPSPAEVHGNLNELILEEHLTLIRFIVDDKAFSDAETKSLHSKDMQRKCITITECTLFANSKITFTRFHLGITLYLHNEHGLWSTIDSNKCDQVQ